MKEIIVKVKSTMREYKRDALEKADLFSNEVASMEYKTTDANLSEKDIQAGKKIFIVKIHAKV
jgi:hypothetical protein